MSRDSENGFGEWGGYMDAKISKLEEQFSNASDPFRQTNLFNGISIFVNGFTNPSSDELKRIMMVHGGIYHHYQRSRTTYIIASNLPDVKVRGMDTSNIISPQWVVDCVKQKKLLDYKKYLLYTNHKPSQPKIQFQKKKEESTNKGIDTKAEISGIFKELEILNKKMNIKNAVNELVDNKLDELVNEKLPSPEMFDVHDELNMDAKISKLEEQFSNASDPFRQTNLFNGISIFVNGFTNPSSDELKRIMMVHGGIYHHYQRSRTTYIIASNLPDVKVRGMDTSNIISPQWVVDCVKQKKLLDYKKYLLYTNHKPSQPKIQFQKKKEESTNKGIDTKAEISGIFKELEILNKKMNIKNAVNELVDNKLDELVNEKLPSPEMFDVHDELNMDAKISKLEEQFSNASDPFRQTNLFNGISIFVNGFTNPSSDELKRIMMVHGGIYHHYQRSRTTYIIASNLPDVKVRGMDTSNIISPQWVVDCVKQKKLLDYKKYLLYTNHKPSQPKIQFQKKKEESTNKGIDTKAEISGIFKELEILNKKMNIKNAVNELVDNKLDELVNEKLPSPEMFDVHDELNMDAKISKLEEQFSNASDLFRQTNLFNGISIFVNGFTNPSSDELKRIMMVHGGIYHHYQRSRTTYIIASNLPDVKVRGMDTSNIISPQWVVDCVKQKKLLDYKKYLLYTNHKPSQPKIQFQKKKEESTNKGIDTKAEISGIFKELEILNKKMNIKNAVNELVDNKLDELVNEKLPSPEMFDVHDELNMDAKISKLEEQFSNASDLFRQTNLFNGISIFVNGFTNPSSDELKRIMMVHGGIYHHYQRSRTTYIIASNLPDVKVRGMDTSNIISPQWVVDCVKQKKLLDYKKYLLYTNHKPSQPKIQFQKKKEESTNKGIDTKAEISGIFKELEILNKKMNIKNAVNELVDNKLDELVNEKLPSPEMFHVHDELNMDAKISKLEEQFSNASDPFRQTNLFNGISIFVNGFTNPSSDELKRIMMVHGGIYHHYQRSRTTYIIASNLPDVKVRGMDTSNIISPQWVVDCVKQKKLLDYKKYLLYTNHKPSQPKIQFQKKKEESTNKGIDTKAEISGIFKELEILNKKMNIKNAVNELVDNKLDELVNEKLPSPEMFDVHDELNMDAKISKLEEQFSNASDPFRQTNLFNGISIFVNGFTNPSSDELKRIMMVHGGIYHHYQRSRTTYIIASNLPDVKVRGMDTSNIISPQWVVDCVKQKKLLDYKKYLLYTNHKPSQPKIQFQKKKEESTNKGIDTKAEISGIFKELEILNKKMNIKNAVNELVDNKLDELVNEKLPSPEMFDVHDELNMDAKISKLEEQFSNASDPFRQTNLFNGISIFVNGFTNPSSDELKRIMMVHGGIYHHYQRSRTTYIIASNLPDVKVRGMDTSNIISPQWVVDCVKQKKLLDYKKYLLYTNHKPSQPKIQFQKKKEESTNKGIDTKAEISGIFKELEILNKKMNIKNAVNELVDNKLDELVNEKLPSPEMFDVHDELNMDAKISKLEEQFSNASDPFRQTNLFNGISIFVNGFTNPSSDELKRIMMVHGGIYHHYQRSRTTYIIASNLPDVKVRGMDTSNIISPQWVVDCVKQKKLLDYKKYLLYTNHKPSQPKIQFQKKKEESTNKGIDTKAEISGIFKELEILNKKMNIKNAVNELVDNKLDELVNEKLPSPEMFDVHDELNNGKPDMLGQGVKPNNYLIITIIFDVIKLQ